MAARAEFTLTSADMPNITVENVTNLTGPTNSFAYWMVESKKEDNSVRRQFIPDGYVFQVIVDGEEDLKQERDEKLGTVRQNPLPGMQHQHRGPLFAD